MTIVVDNVKELPLIIDTSQHNGMLTKEQILSTGCVLLIIRTGISWGYMDKLFYYYRDLCNEIDLPWAGYHVLYPSQPAEAQLENVYAIIDSDPGPCKIPVWNDLELYQSQPPNRIAECTIKFGEGLQREYGGEKGIYSRASFVDGYMYGQSWLNSYYWWLAQTLYSGLEHPGPYITPVGLQDERVIIEQTWWKGKIEGHIGDVDFNRWLRDLKMLEWLIGKEIEIPLTLEEKVDRLVAAHPNLFPELN